MKSIGIIGAGNVAHHLALALKNAGHNICWVYGRNNLEIKTLASIVGSIAKTEFPSYEPDLVLLCVSDDAIASLLNEVPNNWNVAYTSGTVEIVDLKSGHENLGVFYPLQSFSKNRFVALQEVPFLIEGNNFQIAQELHDLASTISNSVQFVSSKDRKSIHLAAVFCNNFVNHLLYQAEKIAEEQEVDFKLLQPLLFETIKKAMDLGPLNAQTGPAKRHDLQTIEKQTAMLEGMSQAIYQTMTKSILETYINA
ncbi:MAG: Rossmann-like and DUF2520 domain-containing protein [Bacteroidota bacterium]